MDRKTQWLSLIAGCALFGYSIYLLFRDGVWTLLIISALIIAFSVSKILKSREAKD